MSGYTFRHITIRPGRAKFDGEVVEWDVEANEGYTIGANARRRICVPADTERGQQLEQAIATINTLLNDSLNPEGQ